jgi:hypothetical protein
MNLLDNCGLFGRCAMPHNLFNLETSFHAIGKVLTDLICYVFYLINKKQQYLSRVPIAEKRRPKIPALFKLAFGFKRKGRSITSNIILIKH